jgi:hypothetical protein
MLLTLNPGGAGKLAPVLVVQFRWFPGSGIRWKLFGAIPDAQTANRVVYISGKELQQFIGCPSPQDRREENPEE